MEDYLQVHEILGTIPFYVHIIGLKLLIQLLKISLHLLYRLFYLVIVVGSIAKCFY